MPLSFSFSLSHKGGLILWQTEEKFGWFMEQLNLMPELWDEYSFLANEEIQYRWLASRFVLQQVVEQSPLKLIKGPSGKPFLLESENHISLSHCVGYVAAIHAEVPVGIDVERISPRVQKIKNYFMRDKEIDLLGEGNCELMLAWSAKESIFKWYGKQNLGFKSQLCIRSIDFVGQVLDVEITTKDKILIQPVCFRQDSEKVLTWTVGEIS
jgi:4'-phosphopantetheinyl transferase